MKILTDKTVVEAALERVAFLLDEFDHVVVNYSGGKDSEVALDLVLRVAEEKGKLPVPVLFIDQEVEWQATIDRVEQVMSDERVKPYWLQVPFKLRLASQMADIWLDVWGEENRHLWMREKHPISIKENTLGVEHFHDLFEAFAGWAWPGESVAHISGMKASESPNRYAGMTVWPCYKWITWGKKNDRNKRAFTFHPIYDFTDVDVWKYINERGLKYNSLYDWMFAHGVSVRDMRVSSLIHDGALRGLKNVHEIEGDTWNRLLRRCKGLNLFKHLGDDALMPKELPPMFSSWREYRDHLLEKLVPDEMRPEYVKLFKGSERQLVPAIHDELHRVHCKAILKADTYKATIDNFVNSHLSAYHVDDEGRAR